MFRPYHQHPEAIISDEVAEDILKTNDENKRLPFEYPRAKQPRRRGRPRKIETTFLSDKELLNYNLAKKLCNEGIITTPGVSFEMADDN